MLIRRSSAFWQYLAGQGRACLSDSAALEQIADIARRCEVLDLNTLPHFSELFMENMSFSRALLYCGDSALCVRSRNFLKKFLENVQLSSQVQHFIKNFNNQIDNTAARSLLSRAMLPLVFRLTIGRWRPQASRPYV